MRACVVEMQQGVVPPLSYDPCSIQHTVCCRNAARCCFASFCNPCSKTHCVSSKCSKVLFCLFLQPLLQPTVYCRNAARCCFASFCNSCSKTCTQQLTQKATLRTAAHTHTHTHTHTHIALKHEHSSYFRRQPQGHTHTHTHTHTHCSKTCTQQLTQRATSRTDTHTHSHTHTLL